MAREVTALANLDRRLPEAGRIRLGKKVTMDNGKERPSKIPHFRFTSADESAIRAIAELYGGTPQPWAGAPTAGQWEVFTNASEIPIVLPPNPLGDSPSYEWWAGGGILRRCDGVTMQVPRVTPDGAEMVDEPCQCAKDQRLACKVTTRLNVILRDVRFGGAWRLDTGSWNAARELPGMVEMIQSLQGAGIVGGLLLLKEHSRIVRYVDRNGETKSRTNKWMVPALAVDKSVAEIVSGDARLGALAPAAVQAIAAGPDVGEAPSGLAVPEPDWLDDDIADAELVDEADVPPSEDDASAVTASRDHTGTEGAGPAVDVPPVPLADDWHERTLKRMHALVRDVRAQCDANLDADVWRHGIVKTATKGVKESSANLTDEELRTVIELLEEIKAGRRRYLGLSMGKVRVSAVAS